jgi:hypothetical protein
MLPHKLCRRRLSALAYYFVRILRFPQREDIILDDEFIAELKTLNSQEIEIIAKRSSQKKS